MKILRLASLFGAVALMAAACLPVTTKTPVGTTVGLAADPALVGTWRVVPKKDAAATDEEGPGYLHFVLDGGGHLTALAISPGKPTDKGTGHGSWSVFAATAAALGSRHYLNVHETFEDGKQAKLDDMQNIPLLYTIDDGTLTLYLIDEKAAKAAIAAGRIDGTVESGDFGDVVLTASADKLDAFLATDEGAGLFTEKLIVAERVE
jgi:hypothetical protein